MNAKTTTTAKAAKTTTTAAKKPHVFALVAGMVRKLENKHLNKAIAYHVLKGNLTKTTEGVKLTEQGATLWNKERVLIDPAKFQEVAAFINGADCPKEWKGQPVAKAGEGVQFPNMLYWGSFSTNIMRQAFASLWAK